MNGLGPVSSEAPRIGAGVARELYEQKSSAPYSRPGDGKNNPRKPTPLQVSDTPSTAATNDILNRTKNSNSPIKMRSASDDTQNSPRSPRANLSAGFQEPKSPRERLEEFLATEDPTTNGIASASEQRAVRDATASPTKASSYSQLRNVSSPLPDLTSLAHSSPPSPHTTVSSHISSSLLRPGLGQNPRTSSIDSAISSISMKQQLKEAGHAHKESTDSIASNNPDISNLISTAGSAEAVIQHLLKEKAHAAAQNAQLWKLVDKQRSLVLGLNKDLERALEDKERYRKKLKDLDKPAPLATAPRSIPVEQRAASAASEASVELPMQKQSEEASIPPSIPENGVLRQPSSGLAGGEAGNVPIVGVAEEAAGSSGDWVNPRSPKPSGSGHVHTKTSSSDINAFGAFNTVPGLTPLQTRDLDTPAPLSPQRSGQTPLSATPSGTSKMSPTNSFTAKRSMPNSPRPSNAGLPSLGETSPAGADSDLITPSRKLPPAPLNLGSAKPDSLGQQYGPEDHSDSDYEDAEVDEIPIDRGRKKTREDDDREREAAISKEKDERSRSMKEKTSKSRSGSGKSKLKDGKTQQRAVPMPVSVKGFSPEAQVGGTSSFLSHPVSLAGVLQPQDVQNESNITERTVNAMPMSPGLPMSPRPTDRPANQPPPTPRLPRDGPGSSTASATSPPLSPGQGIVGLPLSPRAPRQPIPFPPQTPMSMGPTSPPAPTAESRKDSGGSTEGSGNSSKQDTASSTTQIDPEDAPPQHQAKEVRSEIQRARGVFKGFISEAYPNLLIPPNALPSIKIKVVSSRLKPSRNSLVLKGADEEPVFTLGVSARYDRQDLWQVEKPILSLQQLDQSLRQCPGFNVKLPERSLFSGHAPAKIDARRIALETYFESVLDTQLDEKAAVALCMYLSSQVSEPQVQEVNGTTIVPDNASAGRKGSDGRLTKEGYLTKRGKNFGGWKARFFVLNKPVLEYYEAPGGKSGPLGQIRLHNAQIGKQSPKASASPTRTDDGDGQYRHAFLIREPKRKDANSFVDHVLCAENDAERDAWVAALLCYVDGPGSYSETDGKNRPLLNNNASTGSSKTVSSKKAALKTDARLEDSPESEVFDSLQAVPYEETKTAQAPHVSVAPDLRSTETPSPTSSATLPSVRAPSAQSKAISGPQNGAKISDVQAWGNKPMASPMAKPAEPKKRGLWGFRDKTEHLGVHQNNATVNLTQQQQEYQEHATNVKAAFGAPLAEAVEYCPPRGVDICLPAVVYRCLEYLEAKNAAGEEGIFRMSGSNNLIKHLRQKFNTEGDYDFLGENEPYCDVHAVASLLKLYLRELPSFLLTRELHMQFLSVLDIKEDSKKVVAFNLLVHRLPKPNYCLIRALSAYLITVVSASHINKMGVRNVCIVFSPTLNIPNPVLGMFLSAFDDIFEKPVPAEGVSNIPQLEVTSSQGDALTPEDIRSPRKQMFSDPIPTPSYNQDSFTAGNSNSLGAMLAGGQQQQQQQQSSSNHVNHDTGFIPLQPAYENNAILPPSISYSSQTQESGSSTTVNPGPEYAVVRPRNLAPGGTAKSRRRESAMLFMGGGGAGAQRQGSLPTLRGDDDDGTSHTPLYSLQIR